MAEDPKQFLKEVKAGIGPVQTSTTEIYIDFKDVNDLPCRLLFGPEHVFLHAQGFGGFICLSQGQAKRLANTLERFAIAGDPGQPETEVEGDPPNLGN